VRERLLLVAVASCAVVALAATRNGAIDAAAGAVLVGALLLFVRAAFRLLDELDPTAANTDEDRGRTGA
jgi:hypothetical protein